jgi:hypothetical protein
MASTYLSRTTVTPTNATKFTFSAWCKIADVAGRKCILGYNGGNHWYVIQFDNSADLNRFEWVEYNSGGTKVVRKYTSASLRDVNGYYHIVCKYDSTQGTVADRTKLYINGEVADLTTNDNPSHMLSAPSALGGHTQLLGAYANGDNHFNGIISHAHYCDGYAYDASSFGETDATTGEWKIKTSPSVTYGNNGFFVLKDGNSVTDQSGNSNNFTVAGGTLTKTEDCPSNVFATGNPLYLSASKFNFIQGNLRSNGWSSGTSQTWRSIYGTLGASSGKYYFEMKCDNMYSGDTGNIALGIVSDDQVVQTADNSKFFNGSTAYAYAGNGQKLNNDDSIAGGDSYGSSFTTNDIISCAYDLDNGKIYWAKNGTWANSGDPTSGSTGTGSAFNLTANLTYLPAVANYYDDDRWSFNFGNGYFGATAVASAGTNASGNGIFEYDVPTGYTALSTKGLNL